MVESLKIDDLNQLYNDAEASDRDIFAEQRSNILLIAGEHYSKRSYRSIYNNRVNRSDALTETQKLRLTMNHVNKLFKIYVANILSFSPGTTIVPKNEMEMQDQKSAELNLSVWQDAVARYRLKEKVRKWCKNFVGVGEVAVKIFFDPNAGEFIGYQQAVDEAGNPAVDENGEPMKDETKPVFSGGFVFEDIYGMNLLRECSARSMDEAECLIIRKMVQKSILMNKYEGDPEKRKMITESSPEDYVVFDSDKASYQREKEHVLIREFYWKPCSKYPMGYFAITTKDGILEEGELPFGIFPIVWRGCDEYPTSARARSPIKVWRPYQAEINRAASAQAMHQITIGDDKILYAAGSKLAQGALLPGVRGISYQGAPPSILPGRDGAQYLDYINGKISELYSVACVPEDSIEKQDLSSDPWPTLFKNIKQQKKFADYGESFQEFLIDVTKTFLSLAKHYYSDEMVVIAVGRSEAINISEFKNTTPLSFQITVEPQDETIESKFGKQLTLNHILQYVGPQLTRDDIGKVITNMPFANVKEICSDLTLDYQNVKNDMLMLERGQMPFFNGSANHEYTIKKLDARMRQADFFYLSPEIQQLYAQKIEMHKKKIAEEQQKIIDLKNEYIPIGGAMIATDMYVPNPKDPNQPAKRVRIPYQALDWLVKQLETQGSGMDKLESMNKGVMAEMANMIMKGRALPQSQLPSQAETAFPNAQGTVLGVS